MLCKFPSHSTLSPISNATPFLNPSLHPSRSVVLNLSNAMALYYSPSWCGELQHKVIFVGSS